MNKIASTLYVALIGLCGSACGKDKQSSTAPASGEPAVTAPSVPQEPDPPQIAEAAAMYMRGEYQQTIDTLEPLYADLKARQQLRASGLAGAWLALAHSQLVYEKAEEPASHATAMAEQTQDVEVKTMALLATAAFELGSGKYADAAAACAEASMTAKGPELEAMAHTLRGEALIGRAFGSTESESIQNPGELEKAKTAYSEATQAAAKASSNPVLKGRAEEGLAAIARYQGKTADICPHAAAALESYEAGGASEFLRDGPTKMLDEAKCAKK
jgi:hypothetical protein